MNGSIAVRLLRAIGTEHARQPHDSTPNLTLASMRSSFAADGAKVKCEKSSSCKGQSACKNTANSCNGQNACKGQGMTMQKSDSACKDAQALARNLLDKQHG